MGQLKTVIHLHTDYSQDANTSVDDLIAAGRRERIDCIAVTDHNTIRGAVALAARADFHVIIGEEVSTADGHLIGLFLREEIPPGMSAIETARRIHAQGGVVLAPHPFSSVGSYSLGEKIHDMLDHVDAVEILNGQSPRLHDDRKAEALAARYGLPAYVGSDSHLRTSIAPGYQLMDPFYGPRGFLDSLRRATLVFGRHPISYFVTYAWRMYANLLIGRYPAGFGVNAAPPASAASSLVDAA